MVSEYDVFYFVAAKGNARISEIARGLRRETDASNVRKLVLQLKQEGYVEQNERVQVIPNEKAKKLYALLAFCVKNNISYNFMFRKSVLGFLRKVARKEFFTIKDCKITMPTFLDYTAALEKYGFLLVISRKPLTCKLLRHHFLYDLLSFFGSRPVFYTRAVHDLIPKIKHELGKYRKNMKYRQNLLSDIEQREEINFIHVSLSLEGNPVTLSDTEKIIMDGTVSRNYKVEHIQEVANYRKAVDAMIMNAQAKEKLTLPLILEYHRLAMSHMRGAGELRRQNVHILGNPQFKTCEWRLLPEKLADLMKKYGEFNSEDVAEIIRFAAFFHSEFQRIHPFIDGNSRTSRLLLMHILRFHDLPVLDLPLGYFDEYMDLTKRSVKRDDESFRQLIEEIVFFNLRRVNSVL
ncbi:Fic family protein [Candidatus Woesearchaeota archaeon]|nr:Fic family protein [Candidatus Woesearchaeota archaeon]